MTHPQTPPCATRAVSAKPEAAPAAADLNGAASELAGPSRLPATTTTSKAFRIRATPCGPLDRAGDYSACSAGSGAGDATPSSMDTPSDGRRPQSVLERALRRCPG